MSAFSQTQFPDFDASAPPGPNYDDHLKFCGNGDLEDAFFNSKSAGLRQQGCAPAAGLPDLNLNDAAMSLELQMQMDFNAPAAMASSMLMQELDGWGTPSIPRQNGVDFLGDDMMGACHMSNASGPFNPLLATDRFCLSPVDNFSPSDYSFNSSVESIPIPNQSQPALSERSFSSELSSEPGLEYAGSSFNSDMSFDTLYAAHKRGDLLAPPQSTPAAQRTPPQYSGMQQYQQCQQYQQQQQNQQNQQQYHHQTKPIPVARQRRLTADLPKRLPPTSVGSGIMKSNSLSFVHCRPSDDSRRLITYGAEPTIGRRPRGRKNPLTPQQKKDAALMRRIKACENCRLRKEKCDPGIPCRACIEHFRTDLVRTPCRGKNLEDLSPSLLSDQLGWHPTERTLDAYFGPGRYTIHPDTHMVPLTLGFGPPLWREVCTVVPADTNQLFHSHVVYQWPPNPTSGSLNGSHPRCDCHSVFPGVLADTTDLLSALDSHLTRLVEEQHFRQFPLFGSPLEVLRHVYIMYMSLTERNHRHLLHTALKLLVLVHIGDTTKLDPSCPSARGGGTPCFIRGQLGAVIPTLAHTLLREELSALEVICLDRRCDDWPIVLAAMATLSMVVESVQYHAARIAYHASYDRSSSSTTGSIDSGNGSQVGGNAADSSPVIVFGPARPPSLSTSAGYDDCGVPISAASSSPTSPSCTTTCSATASVIAATEEEVDRLFHFYRLCYSGCHSTRLVQPDSEDNDSPLSAKMTTKDASKRPELDAQRDDAASARFIAGLNTTLRKARKYLAGRVHGESDMSKKTEAGQDLSFFFDRLLAKLFFG